MASLLNKLRLAKQQWLTDAYRDTAASTSEALAPEFAELRRILGDQGDASDQVAEAVGRVLARLSAEVETLMGEIGRLQERLDHIEGLR